MFFCFSKWSFFKVSVFTVRPRQRLSPVMFITCRDRVVGSAYQQVLPWTPFLLLQRILPCLLSEIQLVLRFREGSHSPSDLLHSRKKTIRTTIQMYHEDFRPCVCQHWDLNLEPLREAQFHNTLSYHCFAVVLWLMDLNNLTCQFFTPPHLL